MPVTAPATNRPQFRTEQRHELRYHLAIFLADALSWFFLLIPGPARDWIATRLSILFYRGSHTYRRNVEANVCTVLGKDQVDGEVCRIVRNIFLTNGLNFMDLLTLARRSNTFFRKKTQVVSGSFDEIRRAMEQGRGIVFVSGHVGCFDFIGQSFEAHGFPLNVVTGRTTSRFIFDGVTHLRRARGSNLVEPTPAGVRQVMRALRDGGNAVLVADRDFFMNGVPVTFFGKETTLPPGPVRIARDTGAALIPVFTRRTRRGHELRIYPAQTIEKTNDAHADVVRGLAGLVPVLEEGISACLEQWVMFQRAWPEQPSPSVRIFPVGSPIESELLEKTATVVERAVRWVSRRGRERR